MKIEQQGQEDKSENSDMAGAIMRVPASAGLGFSIIDLPGYVKNEAGYHRTFSETYNVARGNITVALRERESSKVDVTTYEEGAIVAIPAGTSHRVLSGSPGNLIRITYAPRRISEDFVHDPELEEAAQTVWNNSSFSGARFGTKSAMQHQLYLFQEIMKREKKLQQIAPLAKSYADLKNSPQAWALGLVKTED